MKRAEKRALVRFRFATGLTKRNAKPKGVRATTVTRLLALRLVKCAHGEIDVIATGTREADHMMATGAQCARGLVRP